MVNAPLLRQAALFHVEHNLYEVSQQKGFPEIISGTSGVAEVWRKGVHAEDIFCDCNLVGESVGQLTPQIRTGGAHDTANGIGNLSQTS